VLKAPILGDDKYGSHEAFEKFELMLNRIDNLHLHCRSLEIPHPIKEGQR
jgi:23S rRNA-/tRNA-specific pseudouridylate synthase